MIDGLCQGYHWSYNDAIKMTTPQIIMLNHAARINSDRMEERMERKKKDDERLDRVDPKVNGVRLSQMNSKQLNAYYRDMH